MTAMTEAEEALEDNAARKRATLRRYLRHPGFMIGAIGIGLLVLVALFAPWIAPHSPTRTDLMNTLAQPSATYWLGTDQFGRCVLSRLIHGAQVSLQVGFFVVLISLSAGTLLGAIAGYAGGFVERALVAIIDIMLAFPSFLLALALVAARGNTLDSIILAVIGVTFAWSLGNAILVEAVFSRPGLGSTILKAILSRDYQLVQAGVLVLAAAVVLLNTALDLIYGAIDPRLRRT